MCGIAGFMHRGERTVTDERDETILSTMAQLLDHRGPDDKGLERRGSVGLAFARLSIIDLEGGHQPMMTEDGRFGLVFNGEIYNFRELREELHGRGFTFRTRSDSEVLLKGYACYGPDVVHRLNGMFALAVHDREENTLFLARDRVGIKPLYYAPADDLLVFGSEMKALLCHPAVDDEIDAVAMVDYLTFGFVVSPRTIYRGIRELPPGCSLMVHSDRIEERRYWSVEQQQVPSNMPEAADQLESLLEDAVRLRMVADVPVGAFLSGGIDSGLVVAFMSRHSERPVKTFSVGFAEDGFDELPWAARVAERYGTDHTEIVCTPNIETLVPRLALAFDQPFADSSAVPTYLVCEEARRQVTVALSGDGGDEGFAGYARHTAALRRSHGALRSLAATLLPPINARMVPAARGAQRLRRLGLDEREFQLDTLTIMEPRVRRRLAGQRLMDAVAGELELAPTRRWGGVFEEEGGTRRFQHQDLTLYLPNDVLEKVDRMSMLHSLEVRVPLLDHRIVQFGLNLPPKLKNDGTDGKLILRELARRHLPAEHLTKPKTGFAIPARKWLAGPLQSLLLDSLGSSELVSDGWLDPAYLRRMIADHQTERSWATALWALLLLELWYRHHKSGCHRRPITLSGLPG